MSDTTTRSRPKAKFLHSSSKSVESLWINTPESSTLIKYKVSEGEIEILLLIAFSPTTRPLKTKRSQFKTANSKVIVRVLDAVEKMTNTLRAAAWTKNNF